MIGDLTAARIGVLRPHLTPPNHSNHVCTCWFDHCGGYKFPESPFWLSPRKKHFSYHSVYRFKSIFLQFSLSFGSDYFHCTYWLLYLLRAALKQGHGRAGSSVLPQLYLPRIPVNMEQSDCCVLFVESGINGLSWVGIPWAPMQSKGCIYSWSPSPKAFNRA